MHNAFTRVTPGYRIEHKYAQMCVRQSANWNSMNNLRDLKNSGFWVMTLSFCSHFFGTLCSQIDIVSIKPDCDKISFTETFMSCSTMFPTRVQEPVASSCGLNEYWVSSNDANRFSFMAQATHYAANTARPNGSATTLLYEQKSLPLLWKGFKCEWSLHFAAETISQAKQLIHFEGLLQVQTPPTPVVHHHFLKPLQLHCNYT